MGYDRTGEPVDEHPRECRGGWLGTDREGRPVPCLACKPHLVRRSDVNDYADRQPSDRARAAIEEENRNDR